MKMKTEEDSRSQVIKLLNHVAEFLLLSDASATGLGAVLLQEVHGCKKTMVTASLFSSDQTLSSDVSRLQTIRTIYLNCAIHFPEMPRLSQAQISEAKECYSIYGRRDGIPISELGNALRSLGINPTNAEIKNIVAEIGSPPSVNYETFLAVLNKDFPPADSPDEIREAFGVFDKDGNGHISATELKHVLMTMGEKLSQDEVDIMIREADIDGDGHIHYEQFVRMMTQK